VVGKLWGGSIGKAGLMMHGGGGFNAWEEAY